MFGIFILLKRLEKFCFSVFWYRGIVVSYVKGEYVIYFIGINIDRVGMVVMDNGIN